MIISMRIIRGTIEKEDLYEPLWKKLKIYENWP